MQECIKAEMQSKVINFSQLGLRDNVAQVLVLENCSGNQCSI